MQRCYFVELPSDVSGSLPLSLLPPILLHSLSSWLFSLFPLFYQSSLLVVSLALITVRLLPTPFFLIRLPCPPARTAIHPASRRALYYFISTISKLVVFHSSQKSSATSSCDDFKGSTRVVQSRSCCCLLHLRALQSRRSEARRKHLLISLHLMFDNSFEIKEVHSFT